MFNWLFGGLLTFGYYRSIKSRQERGINLKRRRPPRV